MGFLSRMASDVQLMLRRPARIQFAALCHRKGKKGLEILLITSRDTGRWVIPKGWPIEGKQAPEVALQEAFEEAGVKGQVETGSVGTYTYPKKLKSGMITDCKVQVHSVAVSDIVDDFPEAHERKRKWETPDVAAQLVAEPELQQLILNFAERSS